MESEGVHVPNIELVAYLIQQVSYDVRADIAVIS